MTSIPVGSAKALHPLPAKLPDLSDPQVMDRIWAEAEKSAKASRRRRLGIFRSIKPVRG